jgi:uncharacterized membrane protein YgdD (TMEM256/DUF423 family)
VNRLDTGTRLLAAAAAVLASVAAALAAAGSHALAARITPAELASFNTAVAFQFVNAIGLFAMAWLRDRMPRSAMVRACGWLLLGGVLLFCGSIYAARFGLTAAAGPAAPIGGTAVILAWAGLAVALLRRPRD